MKVQFFSKTDLIIVISILVLLSTFFLPTSWQGPSDRAELTVCKNNLKHIGISIHQYFQDNSSSLFPDNSKTSYLNIESSIFRQYELEEKHLNCPAERINKNTLPVYIVNPQTALLDYDHFNMMDLKVLEDGNEKGNPEIHIQLNSQTILYGDGHVERIKHK
jgi:type II secretory pathway pseudopilin PulG